MSTRRYMPATSGFVGRPEARSGDDRLRFLLELGARKERQDRLARERAMAVSTHADGPNARQSKKRRLPFQDKEASSLDGEPRTPPSSPPVKLGAYNNKAYFSVQLPMKDNELTVFLGTFWNQVKNAAPIFLADAAPVALPLTKIMTYREFFRLGFGVFLNEYLKGQGEHELIMLPEIDNASGFMRHEDDTKDGHRIGNSFLEVLSGLKQIATVEAWTGLPASLNESFGWNSNTRIRNFPMMEPQVIETNSHIYVNFLFEDADVWSAMKMGHESVLQAAKKSYW